MTDDQKVIGNQLMELTKTSGRRYIVDKIDKKIAELNAYLV